VMCVCNLIRQGLGGLPMCAFVGTTRGWLGFSSDESFPSPLPTTITPCPAHRAPSPIPPSLRPSPHARGHAESFQNEQVRPALGLGPKVPITPERWNEYFALHPEVLARIERQTPWRGPRVGVEMSSVYSLLSGHVHNFGTKAVTIRKDPMSPDQCLLVAAAIYDEVKVELFPPELQERFDDIEALAAAAAAARGGEA
jgi:hypothetical protein